MEKGLVREDSERVLGGPWQVFLYYFCRINLFSLSLSLSLSLTHTHTHILFLGLAPEPSNSV